MSGIDYSAVISEATYFKMEEASPERREYVLGRMYAMSGASAKHSYITTNLLINIHPHLNADCRASVSDLKLKLQAFSAIYYPDLMVTCEHIPQGAVFITNPVLIAEVLSPSTESIDRREKQIAYRTISTLRTYILVSQDEPSVEVFSKSTEGEWTFNTYSAGTVFSADIGDKIIEVAVDAIYRNVP